MARDKVKLAANSARFNRLNGTRVRRERRAAARRMVEQAKAERGNRCERCSGVFPAYVLDFAHKDEHRHLKAEMLKRSGGKASMGALAKQSAAAFFREISLCSLLCANCHRIETYEGKHWIAIGVKVEESAQMALLPMPPSGQSVTSPTRCIGGPHLTREKLSETER